MNHLRTLCLPRRLFQPRAVVLVVLPKYLAVKFFNPVHFDGRLIRSKRPRDSRSGVRRDCPRDLDVLGSVLRELVFPIDFETKPANVEFLGFLHVEDAQNWDGASE
jgi:hypothetical protein